MTTWTIPGRDLPLYIDLECCKCGRLISLSNARRNNRHYLCGKCYEEETMAVPSKKSEGMVKLLDAFTTATYSRSRTESIVEGKCVICGKEAKTFKDRLSEKEFAISGMCQKCQDGVFQ